MKNKQRGNTELLVMVGLFIVMLIISMMISAIRCHARWSGVFPADWFPFQGCRIEVTPGKWIPEDRYREVEQ